MQKTADVSTPSPYAQQHDQDCELIRDILAGPKAMRKPKWLPQYPGEENADYNARLERTHLDDFVSMAIDKATGKLFSKPIKLENIPPDMETLIENIDRQGRALDPFMLDVAKTAFAEGISYVMADMPQTEGVQTLADEKALGIRPYAIHIKPCCLIEAQSGMIGGVKTLVRIKVKECIQEPDGWGYNEIEQIRVWYRDRDGMVWWDLHRQNEKKEWIVVDDGMTSFKGIYLVPFYTNRTGFMRGAPAFQGIAEKNLEHIQLKSDYQAALEMCNFGMYWATGVPEEFSLKVGPRQALKSASPDAKFGIMETSGEAVTLSLNAIQAVESRIETAGVNLRVENSGNVTATAACLDSADTHAALMAVANGFSDSIEQLLGYFAEIMGAEAGDMEAHVCDDFGGAKGSQAGLQEITKARALGDISREAWVDEMKRRGELAEDFDAEEDGNRLDAEGPPLATITKTDKTNIDAQGAE